MRPALASLLACFSWVAACASAPGAPAASGEAPLRVGFLVLDGVYNSELMAPWDVFHHTIFHTQPGMVVCAVGRTKAPVTSFEGLRIAVDHDLASAPPLDVLVVPSAEHNMDSDLDDRALIAWLAERGRAARTVVSLCDGAFLLAEAGLLDGRACTTFPGDVPAFRRRYPHLTVVEDVSFVADRDAITGAGGARSYDPAMYLVEQLYGKQVVEGVGRGLVLDWRLDAVAHHAGAAAPAPARPASYLPGDAVAAETAVLDQYGRAHSLGDVVAAAPCQALVLVVLGGAAGDDEPGRAGMWCEDSFNDLALWRRLVRDFEPRGVRFVAVLCPPVFHAERFGFDQGAFQADDASLHRDNRRRFVARTEALAASGLLPFRERYYDPRFVLLGAREEGAPTWHGRLKWYADGQAYGTPTAWVLRPDLRAFGEPFCRNNYEAEDGRLRYTERDVRARLERLLREG